MITTFQQHIPQQQREVPYASGDFSWLLSGITLVAKMIEAKIRSAGLSGIVGTAGSSNVQGETQQKLDVYANQVLLHCLGVRDSVAALVSEENEQPVISIARRRTAKSFAEERPMLCPQCQSSHGREFRTEMMIHIGGLDGAIP